MSSFLYYSISSNFTKYEIIEIDKQVAKNREAVFFFLFKRKLPSNLKVKAKKLFVYGMFLFQLGQPLAPYACAVMVPLPPTAINRLSSIEQRSSIANKKGYPQIADIPLSKVDKIRLTNDQIQQFNNLALQLNSGSITIDEALLQLRGGGRIKDLAVVFAFVIFVSWYDSFFTQGFQQVPLPHMDPFGWL